MVVRRIDTLDRRRKYHYYWVLFSVQQQMWNIWRRRSMTSNAINSRPIRGENPVMKSRFLWCVVWCGVHCSTNCTQQCFWCAGCHLVCAPNDRSTPKGTFLIHWITFGVSFPVLCTKIALLKLNHRQTLQKLSAVLDSILGDTSWR